MGKDHRSGTAYTIQIKERLFLFWQETRVTEVDAKDRFEHNIDKDGTNLEIVIRGTSGDRKVYVHLRHSLSRESPWPIGPVNLLYPKPEPIPLAELEALRRVAFPSLSTEEERPDKKTKHGVISTDANPRVTSNAKRDWFWVVVGFAIIGGTLIIVILRKFRQRASSNRDGNG